MKSAAEELDHILIKGAREHNLKNIEVKIPKRKLVVLTGVSGSGKSSLAFDTLYAEGQRRYVESLSAYARQFLGQMEKPKYDTIRGLSPTISIEQKTTSRNPRSTVGTITEISDYLRVLFARVGQQHCHQCHKPVAGQTAEKIVLELLKYPKGTRVNLMHSLLVNRKGEHRDVIDSARAQGFVRLRVDGDIKRVEDLTVLDKRKKHTVELITDRLVIRDDIKDRLTDSVEQTLRMGKGSMLVEVDDTDRIFSEHLACADCGISFPALSPQSFSFNSPQGMCLACNGLGTQVAFDPDLVIPDETLSLRDGALKPVGRIDQDSRSMTAVFHKQMFEHLKIPTHKAWTALTPSQRKTILYGTGEKRYQINWGSHGTTNSRYEGLLNRLMRRFRNTKSEGMKRWYAQFLANTPCDVCEGERLRKESAAVTVASRTLIDISAMTIDASLDFFDHIALQGSDAEIAVELLKEIRGRLGFLNAVGLSYLSLNRLGPSLSGGESQRIRLASQIGSGLQGVLYVLDEPSIGLHQRDNDRLLTTLKNLRDQGNTVIVVEHDEEAIREADYVFDIGPGAGVHGGQVVAKGTPQQIVANAASVTGDYLSGRRCIEIPKTRRIGSKKKVTVQKATGNNLQNITVDFPLGQFVCVTGVSGGGKSTLTIETLFKTASMNLNGARQTPAPCETVKGLEHLDKVIDIDQRPIGRTPRSNPATYTGAFTPIRDWFAGLPEAKARGYKPGRFSFNVKGGRCEACQGDGVIKIEMHFLPDVYVECETCKGARYNRETLEVKFKGQSIADVLDMTVEAAQDFFKAVPSIREKMDALMRVGLGYIKVGQQATTLSGGEAQRVKLSKELSKRSTGRTLYILDEPTTGLHFEDVRKLLEVLHELVDQGNSVIVIEHNLDVVKTADHIIDIGPEGGDGGGQVVAKGTPEVVAKVPQSHTGRYLKEMLAAQKSR